jgi:hypothetical protein
MKTLINAAIATLCFLIIAAAQNRDFYRRSAVTQEAFSQSSVGWVGGDRQ